MLPFGLVGRVCRRRGGRVQVHVCTCGVDKGDLQQQLFRLAVSPLVGKLISEIPHKT